MDINNFSHFADSWFEGDLNDFEEFVATERKKLSNRDGMKRWRERLRDLQE